MLTRLLRRRLHSSPAEASLKIFIDSLEQQQQQADVGTCVSLLQSCCRARAIDQGRRVHEYIKRVGLAGYVYVANHLVMMYGRCGCMDEARRVFAGMHDRNVYSWTTMITALARNGHSREALDLVQQMLGMLVVHPHNITFVAALNACCRPEFLEHGRALHAEVCKYGYQRDVIVLTALVSMYSKCGSIEESEKVFNTMPEKNEITWNAMVAAYAEQNRAGQALQVFRRMQAEGIQAGEITYLSLMRAFKDPAHVGYARYIHGLIVQAGLEQEITVGTTLVNMYAKCSSLDNAQRVFDKLPEANLVTWNVLIAAYVQHGRFRHGMRLFRQMQQSGLGLDVVTFINVFSACEGSIEELEFVHGCAVEGGYCGGAMIQSVILNMYAKCGRLERAEAVFEAMKNRTLVSWNTMIAAYSQHGQSKKALELYKRMQAEKVEPDRYTYVSVLDACATCGALAEGRKIHQQLWDRSLETNVGNALLNMYGKCGKVCIARGIFDRIVKVTLSWNSMLAAYAQHGHVEEVLELFLVMLLEGFAPTQITFISVLSAAAYGGLLEKGHGYFTSMQADHVLAAGHEHYGCMVDLLGKAGRLEDAGRLIKEMPYEPDFVTWTSFLGACKNHGDVERGKLAARGALELDPQCAASYVSVSNMFADPGSRDEDQDSQEAVVRRRGSEVRDDEELVNDI